MLKTEIIGEDVKQKILFSTIVFRQGDNLNIQFNVTIDQLNAKPAAGLILKAVIVNHPELQPQIIEKFQNNWKDLSKRKGLI